MATFEELRSSLEQLNRADSLQAMRFLLDRLIAQESTVEGALFLAAIHGGGFSTAITLEEMLEVHDDASKAEHITAYEQIINETTEGDTP